MIGSVAALRQGVQCSPKDIDFICTIEEFEAWAERMMPELSSLYPVNGGKGMVAVDRSGNITEFSIAWGGTNDELLELYPDDRVASLNVLLMLKLSHRYKKNSPHFHKTMAHIKALRAAGAVVEGRLAEVLRRREKETYTYGSPKLKKSKATFFSDSDSFYKYEHDDIHEAVAVGLGPAYALFSSDGQEVHSSKDKWTACSRDIKLLAGLEESYVLAIERSLVPHPGVLTPKQAFTKALEKVCTSITSGWFREFCWENYGAIQSLYSDDYYQKFLAALAEGRIRDYQSVEAA